MSSGGTPGTGGAGSGGSVGTGGAPATGGRGGAPGTGGSIGNGGASSGGRTGGGGGAATGGASGGGGRAATGGRAGTGGSSPGSGGAGGASNDLLSKFSFFVTSLPAMVALSGKADGFGGDLRFGKADGLTGADEICRQIAERGMPGAGQKQWRAFLSVTAGAGGGAAVNARDRIGMGPWYDSLGRVVANDLTALFAADRPGGEAAVVNDLPNENGEPNHYVGPGGVGASAVDNHDTLTGSDAMGRLRATGPADTCNDWTSTTATGRPWIGHSWPRSATNGRSWVSDHQVPGCTAGVDRTLGGTGSGSCIGCSGGYGGFYCFALR